MQSHSPAAQLWSLLQAAGFFDQLIKASVQVLLDLKRTASTVQPGQFSFGDHFVFEALIGRSKHSEVCRQG